MGATHLSKRENWQMGARIIGDAGENDFATLLAQQLPSHYTVRHKPKKLVVYSEGRGIKLDTLVTNDITNKNLYIEKKTGNNGGNAHERVYKFLSVPLKRVVREKYNTVTEPFFMVFSGKTFQGQKYKDELSLLLEGQNHAIMEPDFTNISQVAKQIMEIV
tara:strand:+ start:294 stop:776 length:483 start_codon:yes stop_codon:yes gene_type:complete